MILGKQVGMGLCQGPVFPNASVAIPQPGPHAGCPDGCLFYIENDLTEKYEDTKEQYPQFFFDAI